MKELVFESYQRPDVEILSLEVERILVGSMEDLVENPEKEW